MNESSINLPRAPAFNLGGRRALVTGAGRGIGAGAAAALADAGAAVTLLARTASEIDEVAAVIRDRGGEAHAIAVDVSDAAAIRALVNDLPPFDILVNNAGTNRPKPMVDVTPADYSAVMDLNVRATYFVSQAVCARMAQGAIRGSVIHVSSQMGHVGAANRTLYCMSKFAVEGLTKAMAVELAPLGIRVNSLCPTFIETPMTAGFLADDAFRTQVLSKIKLGRLARVDDLLGGLIYLASDASGMVTGSSLLIDGGWTAD
ncbi:SDR family NAD(P)-dependent oxidoreductase [Paraburkholderia sp. J67]|uniref:SDR family NAD(P)-dependent oxidoreductase n=1 Tax=Paraburkholderia sp. J67 TaxID=2805435 RepID=UPI002ABE09B7|nr:SDR family oxidoreductase [Paraburkholderia sp. J67]